jgi:glycosyltransferase involved in cell wall biosynthesis
MPDAEGLVSIVLPTYNGRRYIAASIESCLGQTYRDIELIVVDGGSTDGTLDEVRRFSDPRIRVLHQPDNTGLLPGALNVGFAAAEGEYFSWTQDDDCYAPDAIEAMLAHLQSHADVEMVYAAYWEMDEAGRVLREKELGPPEALRWTNPVGPCFLYRRRAAEAVGPYREAFFMAEDAHYWMRIHKHGKMSLLPGRYFYHRLHGGNLTGRAYGRYLALRVAARARREVLGLPWLEYQRQVAAAYVEEAFAAHADGALGRVRACLARGLARNPGWLANRGVWSIGLESLVGPRAMRLVRRPSRAERQQPARPQT